MSMDSIFENINKINSELDNELAVTDAIALSINARFKLDGDNSFKTDNYDNFMNIYNNIIIGNDILNRELKEIDDKFKKIALKIPKYFNYNAKTDEMQKTIIKEEIKWCKHPYFDKYQFSSKGDVRNIESGELIRQNVDSAGFKRLSLNKNGKGTNRFRIHRLVAEVFVKNPEAGLVV